MAKRKREWTDEQIAAVISHCESGKTWEEISAIVGRPAEACKTRYYLQPKELRKQKPKTRRRNMTPMRMHTGETYGAVTIGDALPGDERRYHAHWECCESDAVLTQAESNAHRRSPPSRCAKCHAKEPSDLPWTADEDATVLRLRTESKTWAEIAAHMHRTVKATQERYYSVRAKRPQASPGDLYGLWTRAMDAVRAAQ